MDKNSHSTMSLSRCRPCADQLFLYFVNHHLYVLKVKQGSLVLKMLQGAT